MTRLFLIAFLGLLAIGCTKNQSDPIQPDNLRFCSDDPLLLGNWASDSVRITTLSDTLDSTITRLFFSQLLVGGIVSDTDTVFSIIGPSLDYRLNMACGGGNSDATFEYFSNHSNQPATVVKSTNYVYERNIIYYLGAFESIDDTANAGLQLHITDIGDSTLNGHYWLQNNAIERTKYAVFMRRI